MDMYENDMVKLNIQILVVVCTEFKIHVKIFL